MLKCIGCFVITVAGGFLWAVRALHWGPVRLLPSQKWLESFQCPHVIIEECSSYHIEDQELLVVSKKVLMQLQGKVGSLARHRVREALGTLVGICSRREKGRTISRQIREQNKSEQGVGSVRNCGQVPGPGRRKLAWRPDQRLGPRPYLVSNLQQQPSTPTSP